MKKVLFTATEDYHIEAFHLPYLKLFKDNGYEVYVATNTDKTIKYCDKKIKVSFERSPFKLNNLRAIFALKKVIKKEKFDIIHCNTPMGGVVTRLAARKARKKYNTRVIYTAHGFHFYKGAPKKNWIIYYTIEKWLAKYTDTIITINQEDYETASDKFKNRCKDIEYVPGVGINEDKFNFKMSLKEQNELKESLGIKKDDFVLIYIARIEQNKNQIFLINALEKLLKKYNNIHLLLPGLDCMNGYCQKLCEEKGISKNVHFLGFRGDIPQLLKISDLSVSSSLREGLPVNVIESFGSKKAVVALNCRGMKDLIDDGINGYIIKNEQDMINKILYLYDNRDILNDLGDNAYKKFDNYKLIKISERMKEVYELKKKNTIKVLFCHDGPVLNSKDKYYGRAINNEMLTRYLFFSSDVSLLIRTKKMDKFENKSGYSELSDNYSIISCPNISSLKGIIFNRSESKRIISESVKNSDLIIARLPSFFGFYSIKFAKKYNKNYLIELVGCPWDSFWYHSFKGKILAPFFTILTKKVVKEAPFVHYVSQKFLQQRYPTNGLSLSCSDVVLNKCNVNKSNDRINKLFSKDSVINIGTIANVDIKFKGQRYVIKAISELKKQNYKINYILIGGGNPSKLKKLALKYNVSDEIKFMGPVKHSDIDKIIDSIDIYIQPSNAESHGRVILEAMNESCPCIGSTTGGIPELVNSEFVFKRKSVKDLKEKIEKIINLNKIEKEKIILYSYHTALKYQEDILTKKREDFYLKIKEQL